VIFDFWNKQNLYFLKPHKKQLFRFDFFDGILLQLREREEKHSMMIATPQRQGLFRPAIKARLAPSSGRLTGRVRRFGAYSCQWARLQGGRDRRLHAGRGAGICAREKTLAQPR
jgi:hypothetical protein